MASRWRRFAFFDRSNVPLPKSVQVELLPHDGNDNYGRPTSSTSTTSTSTSNNNVSSTPSLIAVPTNIYNKNPNATVYTPTDSSTLSIPQNKLEINEGGSSEHCRILLYIASRNSSKIHSIDVTDKVTSNSNPALASNCGYRGSFLPHQNKSITGGILGLAACKHGDNGNIHLASISSVPNAASEVAVTVTINPHLKLKLANDDAGVKNKNHQSSSSGGDHTIDAQTLLSSTNNVANLTHSNNGCVDITSEKHWCYVAVGTHSGKVMLYSYYAANDLETVVSHDCVSSSSNNDLNGAADNPWAAPKMTLVCEIAAPNHPVNLNSNSNSKGDGSTANEAIPTVTSTSQSLPSGTNKCTAESSTNNNKSASSKQSYSVTSVQFVPTQKNNNNSDRRTNKNKSSSNSHHYSSSSPGGQRNPQPHDNGGGAAKPPVKLFVCYHRHSATNHAPGSSSKNENSANLATAHGVCCYEINPSNATSSSHYNSYYQNCIETRVDLDGRDVANDALCGLDSHTGNLVVARTDGLYVYSPRDHRGAAAVEGEKYAMCSVPPVYSSLCRSDERCLDEQQQQQQQQHNSSSSYALIATMDGKSNRDSVDLYDASNKLVAFHMLLSPGHRALRAYGIHVPKELEGYGRASAVLLTSGGTIVTLTEKSTAEKVNLLLQKNLYAAAISIAFADPSYPSTKVAVLYRQHAEYLYQKGDIQAAMDQYILTIGSLEPSHVIFRYLDAPKIPLLVKYLEVFRLRGHQAASAVASSVHDDLLRTCYLKLNDTAKAEKLKLLGKDDSLSLSSSGQKGVSTAASYFDLSELANGLRSPSEALAILCSFEAEEAAQAMEAQGPYLVKSLPRETAGVVISLCDGTYSPNSLTAARSLVALSGEALESLTSLADRPKVCRLFPVEMFCTIFLEQPKLLRLILSHCKRRKCTLPPALRRTHLELTLEEWFNAKRDGDEELEHARAKEAMIALTDSFIDEIGAYEALVLVQLVNFSEGEVLLYEKLQMGINTPVLLLDRYAADGGERARRQMLAMCQQGDPELLADVLGHFVTIASNKYEYKSHVFGITQNDHEDDVDDGDDDSEGVHSMEDIMEDIQETLDLAKAQGVLPPVRIARILAGEGTGQFSCDKEKQKQKQNSTNVNLHGSERKSVPLTAALDYIGSVLDESTAEIERLKREVLGYHESCNDMQAEIDELLLLTNNRVNDVNVNINVNVSESALCPNLNVEAFYAKLCDSLDDVPAESTTSGRGNVNVNTEEEFWRDMGHCDGDARFGTIARYFGKGLIP